MVICLLAAGCANSKHYAGLRMSDGDQAALVSVPVVAQQGKNDCGYAALASVALYHGVDPALLAEGKVPQTFQGERLSAEDLKQMAGMLDLAAWGYPGNLEDLKKNVGRGRPMLVLLAKPPTVGTYPGLEWWADRASSMFVIPHWVVVVGFTGKGDPVVHDPRKGLLAMSQKAFVECWQRRSNLSVLVSTRSAAASERTASR
jgi:ABC-type bacteriocin/lantibiotic exporter with double-glycine peptidase domain